MEEKTKSRDFYESLKIRGLKKERELNSKIQQFLNKKDFIEQASSNSVKFAHRVRNLQETMETMSIMWNFPTKRDVANLAKMQVQLEEKIDHVEEMLSRFLANGNKVAWNQSFPPANQSLQKSGKKQRLQQLLKSTLDQNVASFHQRNNSYEK